MSATLEETVAAEQAAHDDEIADDDAAHEEADPDGKALFDRSQYQAPGLRIDQVDGQEVDKLIRLGKDVEYRLRIDTVYVLAAEEL